MEQVNLEVVDIVNATKVIEAAIERGVFKAGEMSGVAGIYDKFSLFVEQQTAIAEAAGREKAEQETKENK